MTRILLIGLLAASLLPLKPVQAQTTLADATPGLVFINAPVESIGLGEEVDVWVQARNVANVYAYDLEITYPADQFEVIDLDANQTGVQPAVNGGFLTDGFQFNFPFSASNGKIRLGYTQLDDRSTPPRSVSGDQTANLLRFRLRGKVRGGPYALTLSNVQLSTKDGDLIAATAQGDTLGVSNRAPAAVNDAFATAEEQPLTILKSGLLANDSDADGDALTISSYTQPATGVLTRNGSGDFSYQPPLNFFGQTSFTYTITDGFVERTATVTLTVTAVNDAPAAGADGPFALQEDSPLRVTAADGVLKNDSDVEGDALQARLVSGPAHGSLALGPDGGFLYAPDANWSGEDSFTYSSWDGKAASAVITVLLRVTAVNDAPVAVDDQLSTGEDTALVILMADLLANDIDVDGDGLRVDLQLPQNTGHGALAAGEEGSLVYTPAADYNGPDFFYYSACDTALCSLARVTVTVTVGLDEPTALPDEFYTLEDTPLAVLNAALLANDWPGDGPALELASVTQPEHGELTALPDGSGYTYTPARDYYGDDRFTYSVRGGEALLGPVEAQVVVAPVNDAPALADGQTMTALEDHLAQFAPAASDVDLPAGGRLTYQLDSGPAHGGVQIDDETQTVTYLPDPNYFGDDDFSLVAFDGQALSQPATVNVTVSPVNDAPGFTLLMQEIQTDEDSGARQVSGVTGDLNAGPNEAEQTLAFELTVDQPALFAAQPALTPAGELSFTPAANAFGTALVMATLRDNGGVEDGGKDASAKQTLRIVINPVNDAPTGADDAYSTDFGAALMVSAPGVLANDADLEGDALRALLVSGPASGALDLRQDGSLTFTPAVGFSGNVSFTYRPADSGNANGPLATVTITVGQAPLAPANKIFLPALFR